MSSAFHKVSIIVPVYNVESYIEQCARSIFEQTYKNLEIIFVDDCCTDGSITMLKKVLDKYPGRKSQVTIINNATNLGSTISRSKGMKSCNGDYILCIDSDDYIDCDMVERLMQVAQEADYDIVASSFYINTPSSETRINIDDCNNYFSLNRSAIDTLHFSLCNKIIKKSIIDKLPDTPNANCWDDLALSARAFALAKSARVINAPYYHYRVGENKNSQTAQSHKKRLHEQITVARFVEQWFIDNHLDTRYATFLKNMKFTSKIKFLRGKQRDFAAWKSTFPETNHGILGYNHISLPYRLLFFLASILPSRFSQWISDTIG